jgi:hypothetical protein
MDDLSLHCDHHSLLHFVAGYDPDLFLSLFLHIPQPALSYQLSAISELPPAC